MCFDIIFLVPVLFNFYVNTSYVDLLTITIIGVHYCKVKEDKDCAPFIGTYWTGLRIALILCFYLLG